MQSEFPQDPLVSAMRESTPFLPWEFRPDSGWATEFELIGYHVEAVDGSIGKVKQATHARDASHLVVDTGPWIFGHQVIVPAGTVTHIDHTDHRVYLDRTKEQVRSAPEYDADQFVEPAYRDKVGGYYGDTYRTR